MNAENLLNPATTNNLDYIELSINQALLEVNTIVVARIIKINKIQNKTDTANIKLVYSNVLSNDTLIDSPIVIDVPILAIQGGNAGIKLQYQVNDLVLVGVCQRDISDVFISNSEKSKPPQSNRFFNIADAVIISKLINENPSVYIEITDNGINIEANNQPINVNSASEVNINSSNINLGNGALSNSLNGNTKFQVKGVQAGNDILSVDIVPGTESKNVKVS